MSAERKPGSYLAIQYKTMMRLFFGEEVTTDQADQYAQTWMREIEQMQGKHSRQSYRNMLNVVHQLDKNRHCPTPYTLLEKHLQIRFK